MRKDQLVRALVRAAKSKASKSDGSAQSNGSGGSTKRADPVRRASAAKRAGTTRDKSNSTVKRAVVAKPNGKNVQVLRRLQQAKVEQANLKNLAHVFQNGQSDGQASRPAKDRAVLMVRDPYWLHVCWELSRQSVLRAQAAMAEHWHASKPILRLCQVDTGTTTSTSERVLRDIEIHGGVNNWYIDVQDPPKCYRVEIGYVSPIGKFYSLARSSAVNTPRPDSSDAFDKSWMDVSDQCEKIYAMSGGYATDGVKTELQELFEERLHRPMGEPMVMRFGAGAEGTLNKESNFQFEIDCEMIIYGVSTPASHLTLAGEPIKLRPDGTFSVRVGMPERRQVIPVVARSGNGAEQRTIVLAVERNTKVMEPIINDPNT